MNAVQSGDLESMKFLLSKGADVNAVSNEKLMDVKNGPIMLGNLTALMIAAPSGNAEMVRVLLRAGASGEYPGRSRDDRAA